MIIIGDALEELKKIKDNSVQCCVTSPPYFHLRDYGNEKQIGLEDTIEEYIEKLVAVFREVRRVLKRDGTLWLNISDCYAGSGKGKGQTTPLAKVQASDKGILGVHKFDLVKPKSIGVKPKDMMGIPWLLALALRDDGWYLRQDIIWQKPNCMPESVKDRCVKQHEYIFLLSKSKRYLFNWEAIREPSQTNDKSQPRGSKGTERKNSGRRNGSEIQSVSDGQPLRRKRSVWIVPTGSGGKSTHYATYPKKLVLPCILAGSDQGDVVLDPFAGSGTTGVVAKENGRKFILIELSSEYAKICHDRLDG